MKAILVKNGKLQLILAPSDEVDKILLTQLSKTPVEMHKHSTLQVGTENVTDAIVIMAAEPKDRTFTKAELRKAYYAQSIPEHDDSGDVNFLAWLKDEMK